MPAPVVIDPEILENLRALSPDDGGAFVREIRDIFFEDTPRRLAELDECLASGDGPKFSRTAHTIKGSSANLGAVALRDVADQLEQQSKTKGTSGLGALVLTLKDEFSRAKTEILRLIP